MADLRANFAKDDTVEAHLAGLSPSSQPAPKPQTPTEPANRGTPAGPTPQPPDKPAATPVSGAGPGAIAGGAKGAAMGAARGTRAGASKGAELGSSLGPVGTAVGGVLGGLSGGALGGLGGGARGAGGASKGSGQSLVKKNLWSSGVKAAIGVVGAEFMVAIVIGLALFAAFSGSGTDTANAGNPGNGIIVGGTSQELAGKILGSYQPSGKYHCDNSGDCEDLRLVAAGQSIRGRDGCSVDSLDPRVLQLMIYIMDNGFKLGTYALCGDHFFDSPNGHSGGKAVDISSVNGTAVVSSTGRAVTLQMDQFLNKLPAEISLRQLISGGYGNIPDQAMINLEINGGKPCPGCFPADEADHRNHIHVGY